MIGAFQATLYDLFGYFLPGAVGVVAIALVFWGGFHSTAAVDLTYAGDGIVIAGFIVVGYVFGHVLHGLGNKFARPNQKPDKALITNPPLSPALLQTIDVELEKQLGAPTALNAREKYGLMDEARNLKDREGNREVYIYLEGFYIGMTMASALLVVGLLFRLAAPQSCLILASPGIVCLNRGEVLLLAVFSVVAVYVFTEGRKRFNHYRVERAALLWLALTKLGVDEKAAPPPEPSPELVHLLRILWKRFVRRAPPPYRNAFRRMWRKLKPRQGAGTH